jgi:phytoene synthase
MDELVTHGEASIRKGSSSFRAASRLFSPSMREDAWLLYAWCRRCDDDIDGQTSGFGTQHIDAGERRRRLDELTKLTRAALAGEPMSDPDFAAFQRVVFRHELDPRWPLTLLQGFAMDVEHRSYETLDDTLDYCFAVAGVVGVMMGRIMGVRDIEALRRAQDLGLAFQLTNIVRDIYEDARNGRVYLPNLWLREAGVQPCPEGVLDCANAGAIHAVALRLLRHADQYYDSARLGLQKLPARAALAVAAARDVYREIGRIVERGGPAALATRASSTHAARIRLMLRGCAVAAWSRPERLQSAPARPALWTKV